MGKKRPTLKANPNRGFATTSVPKKPVAQEDDQPTPAQQEAAGDGVNADAPRDGPDGAGKSAGTDAAETAQILPGKVGSLAGPEQELQDLVERVLDKAEREASRLWKIIEFDQRLSKSLTPIELPTEVRERVLDYFNGVPNSEDSNGYTTDQSYKAGQTSDTVRPLPWLLPSAPESPTPFLKSSEAPLRQLHRALITQSLLINLGFSPSLALAAIRFAPSLELEDCLSYLILTLPAELLDDPARLSTYTATTPASELASAYDEARRDGVDASRPPPHRGYSFTRVLTSAFDAREAATRAALQAAQAAAREARIAARKQADDAKASQEDQQEDDAESTDAVDQDHEDGDSMFGDIFEELPATVEDSSQQGTGVTIEVRTIPPVPKGAAAKNSPQTLLNDALRRIDEFAVAKFHKESSGGKVCRSRLEIRWSNKGAAAVRVTAGGFTHVDQDLPSIEAQAQQGNGPSASASSDTNGQSAALSPSASEVKSKDTASENFVDIYTLTGIATATQPTADDLIATVALHTIERERPVQRNLSSAYRQWWDELDGVRKAQSDQSRRRRIAVVQDVLALRLQAIERGQVYQAPTTKKMVAQPSSIAVEETVARPEGTAIEDGEPVATESAASIGASRHNETIQKEFADLVGTAAYQKMLLQRRTLPITAYRDHILEIVDNSSIFVLSGETGCGKSTQVPAFVLEHCMSKGRPCKIYVTEPRRISAISLAERVSSEMGEAAGVVGTDRSLVGYAIRLESQVGRRARLVYATTGIVLRMLEGQAFDEITHLIIDEVHERSIESDFLLIVLKTLMEHRRDLKVILMSATVDADRISAYFGGCPTIAVPGRTFPVKVQYLEDAVELCDYVLEDASPYAYRDRRGKGSNRMFGDVQNKAHLSAQDDEAPAEEDDDAGEELKTSNQQLAVNKYKTKTISTLDRMDEYAINHELIVKLVDSICTQPELSAFSQAILIFMPGIMEIRKCHDLLQAHPLFGSNVFRIYPLHSTISSDLQSAVFDIPPKGVRKIVIATNIAETGITIPDITCVIDTGKHREMRYDEKRQISKLVECFVARSNAKQRRGRAGRVQEGLCFHLFTKHRHDNYLADHPQPEMLRLSLQELALKLKIMKIKIGESIQDALTQALDPPTETNIQRAVAALIEVKALTTSEDITALGRHLSRMPLDVHMGKFLLIASMMRCLDPALTIAAALNSKSPFVAPFGREDEADRAKASFKAGDSDFLTVANAFNAWRRACSNNHHWQFCNRTFLSYQTLQQIEDLRQQYMAYLLDSGFVKVDEAAKKAIARLRYRAGSTSGKPRLMELPQDLDANSGSAAVINAAMAAALYPKLLQIDARSGQLKTVGNNAPASIHPSSVNRRLRFNTLPDTVHHLLYYTMMQNAKKKMFAWDTAPADDRAVVLMCGDANYYIAANSIYIDRQKVRYSMADRKALLALRLLRDNLWRLINATFRAPRKEWSEKEREAFVLAMDVLGCRAGPADEWQLSPSA